MTTITARKAWKQFSSFRRANSMPVSHNPHHANVAMLTTEIANIVYPALERARLGDDLLAKRQPEQYANASWLRSLMI